jgi:hypothetical protein
MINSAKNLKSFVKSIFKEKPKSEPKKEEEVSKESIPFVEILSVP